MNGLVEALDGAQAVAAQDDLDRRVARGARHAALADPLGSATFANDARRELP